MTRREALARLAKYSAYTAPTVVTLLVSEPTMAGLTSCAPGQTDENNSAEFDRANRTDTGSDGSGDRTGPGGGDPVDPNNTPNDCGI